MRVLCTPLCCAASTWHQYHAGVSNKRKLHWQPGVWLIHDIGFRQYLPAELCTLQGQCGGFRVVVNRSATDLGSCVLCYPGLRAKCARCSSCLSCYVKFFSLWLIFCSKPLGIERIYGTCWYCSNKVLDLTLGRQHVCAFLLWSVGGRTYTYQGVVSNWWTYFISVS